MALGGCSWQSILHMRQQPHLWDQVLEQPGSSRRVNRTIQAHEAEDNIYIHPSFSPSVQSALKALFSSTL